MKKNCPINDHSITISPTSELPPHSGDSDLTLFLEIIIINTSGI